MDARMRKSRFKLKIAQFYFKNKQGKVQEKVESVNDSANEILWSCGPKNL